MAFFSTGENKLNICPKMLDSSPAFRYYSSIETKYTNGIKKMKAVINQSVVHLTYKASEFDFAGDIINTMCSDVNSLCVMELYETEATLSYSSDEITVSDIKRSYSDAKKINKK